MKDLFSLFKNPTHYLGTEYNSVHKDPKRIKLRWALVFPDLYPVGMSYLGLQVIYSLLNSSPYIWAERSFAPHPSVGKILKKNKIPLFSLESKTPLKKFDVIGFSLTHELCYTTVLYILDLAEIPFWAKERENKFPIIIAGGDATFNPEPVSPFFDLFFIGEAEEAIFEISDKILKAKENNISKFELLKELSKIVGVHVPLFKSSTSYRVERRILSSLDTISFPKNPIIPFGKPVHDRFTVEIAKGCTRGCRFCLAGMVSRPVRERGLENIKEIVKKGILDTGYEEISFLSLSSGDFSKIEDLLLFAFNLCNKNKISISLPSLRIDSFNNPIFLRYIANIRKTGITLAPEAGSQRLRNIINKTITHDEIIEFAKILKKLGWQNLKLYFMVGLPFEKEEDVLEIANLCFEIKKVFSSLKRHTITASVAGFVPKPHTPFQWTKQEDFNSVKDKILSLKSRFKPHKTIKLKWHDPKMSFIEGVFSRGDEKLAHVLITAYKNGDILTSWDEFFDFDLWLKSFEKCDIDPYKYIESRPLDDPLPWDYICTGVSKKFLINELKKAEKEEITQDCRYDNCLGCGVCNKDKKGSLLKIQSQNKKIEPVLNTNKLDNSIKEIELYPKKEKVKYFYRIWYEKIEESRFLSQIELQKCIERILRRAHLPICFSEGFHPKPLLSFGRALSVGIESLCEWFLVGTYKELEPSTLNSLNQNSIKGLYFYFIEKLPKKIISYSKAEKYLLFLKKKIEPTKNPYIKQISQKEELVIELTFSWEKDYKNPVQIIKETFYGLEEKDFLLRKFVQCIE